MRTLRFAILVSMMVFVGSSIALAADFDWMKNLNAQVSLDPSGFQGRSCHSLQHRRCPRSARCSANVPEPANAYMVFRLGEMSHQPVEKVMEEYKRDKGKGWGVMAKNLGIKPGSARNSCVEERPRSGRQEGLEGQVEGQRKREGQEVDNSLSAPACAGQIPGDCLPDTRASCNKGIRAGLVLDVSRRQLRIAI